MLPLPLRGIVLGGGLLLSRYRLKSSSGQKKMRFVQRPDAKHTRSRASLPDDLSDIQAGNVPSEVKPVHTHAGSSVTRPKKATPRTNPVQTLTRGITSAVSQVSRLISGEDYNAVAGRFAPAGAKLLTPQFPSGSKGVQLADLDGDSKDELVASYKLVGEIRTIALKKQGDNWHKIGEFSCPEYDALYYMGALDMAGNGRKQLLMSLTSKGRTPALYGYSLENNSFSEVFSRSCHRFQVVGAQQGGKGTVRPYLAIWNKRDDDTYDIEMLRWNGSRLEPSGNHADYYRRNVIPHHMNRVRAAPYSPAGWYGLAHSLAKTGAHSDALQAIKMGMAQDRDSSYRDKFQTLKDEITGM